MKHLNTVQPMHNTEGKYSLAANGTLYKITAVDDATKTITLDNITGLVVGDYLSIYLLDAPPVLAISITAINGLVVTLNTTLSMSSIWVYAVKKAEVIYPAYATGYNTLATGIGAHAEGYGSIASGEDAHAEGDHTIASGSDAHAEGDTTKALGNDSHAEGALTIASATRSHAEGWGSGAYGENAHAEGQYTSANGNNSHSEGKSTIANGNEAHAEGDTTIANGGNSHAEGSGTKAYGKNAHAEGDTTKAEGETSHAEGLLTVAASNYSHAEGQYTMVANGELYQITAFDNSAKSITLDRVSGLAIGDTLWFKVNSAKSNDTTIANITGLVVILNTTDTITSDWKYVVKLNALQYPAHAEGINTLATGSNSHASGESTIAKGNSQAVFGRFNKPNDTDMFIIGNGTDDNNRKNIFSVDNAGNVNIPSGASYKINGEDAIVSTALRQQIYDVAGGTNTGITLENIVYEHGFSKTFLATTNNDGIATTINGKALYKPNTTDTPKLIAGKAYTIWYDLSKDCFFLKASAEGNTVAEHVLAGDTFSNEEDTNIMGTMPNKTGQLNVSAFWDNANADTLVSVKVPKGYYPGEEWNLAINIPTLISDNIRANTAILGVQGNVNVVNTADATAVDTDVAEGLIYYAKGAKRTGTKVQPLSLHATGVYVGQAQNVTLTPFFAVGFSGVYYSTKYKRAIIFGSIMGYSISMIINDTSVVSELTETTEIPMYNGNKIVCTYNPGGSGGDYRPQDFTFYTSAATEEIDFNLSMMLFGEIPTTTKDGGSLSVS